MKCNLLNRGQRVGFSRLSVWAWVREDFNYTHTPRQILTAFDYEKVMTFCKDVKWLPANRGLVEKIKAEM